MAALGKIRSKGLTLIIIIGLGLFAFIAEEAFRSCEAHRNDQRQCVGEVYGEKINVQDFQKLVDEYSEVIKMQQGTDNLNEQQLNQVKDMVWNTFVQTKMVEKEAKALGLTVTDQEIQNILKEGTNQMLLQTPFVNQQTGRFDVNALQNFLNQYNQAKTANPQMAQQYSKIYNYWTFIEKTLRQQTLAQKYQSLLAHCLLSNPVEAKMAFKEENEESKIQLAVLPYSSIQDSKVQITESDLKAKYNELKPRFKQSVESRDVKYIDIQVEASATDKAAIRKQFAAYAKELATATDPAQVVRKSTSLVNYLGIPVASSAYPSDIAAKLDSMAVGQLYGPVANQMDNTMNIIKLVAKQQLPDSIQFRAIQVGGVDAAAAQKTADSIYTALQADASQFEALAKKYGQTGEKQWITTAQYQNAPSMDVNTKNYINALNNGAVNQIQNLKLDQANVILQVVDRKAMISKYTAAVIKKTIDFSKETYSAAYNKFASFVSANQNSEDLLKNAAKNGYKVLEANDVTTSSHYLANIHSTRDALKWLFEAKKGDISPLYECGDNDHLLVAVCSDIHPIGYRSLDDAQVKEMVKAEVLRDKKAEQLMAKLQGVNSIAAAKAKGAQITTVDQITFAAPVFVSAAGASEPALSGAVYATAKGKFSSKPVKGNAGVYAFQVVSKKNRPGKFDAKTMEARCRQKAMQYAGNFMSELYQKANVVDNRYLFF
ncbi:MAG: SurA N-terminal domain-containing protein [Prevotella sp.]|nr:SurA N-terminal domain-containing protein [Prevotella sp.]